MGAFARLVRAIRGFFRGDDRDADTDAEHATSGGAAAGYRCAVCGTPVEDTDDECPLCRSTDLVPAGGGPADAGTGIRGSPPGTTVTEGTAPTVGDALSGRDPLAAHGDRWTRTADGAYRVSLPDGGTERVASKGDVRALLLEHYGPPDG